MVEIIVVLILNIWKVYIRIIELDNKSKISLSIF